MRKNFFAFTYLLFSVTLATLLLSCQRGEPRLSNTIKPDLDSLWLTQVALLMKSNANLQKEVTMNDTSEVNVSQPKDSLAWVKELEILRAIRNLQLASNFPLYTKTTYKDSTSNLMVTAFQATKALPLKSLKLFKTQKHELKKIEAEFAEQNSLLDNQKKIILFFSEVNNKNRLTSYSVKGYQHMVLSDTLQFELKANIIIL